MVLSPLTASTLVYINWPQRRRVSRSHYPKIAQLKTVEAFRAPPGGACLERRWRAGAVGGGGVAAGSQWVVGQPLEIQGRQSLVHSSDGRLGRKPGRLPLGLTLRRWRHFGLSGAKLIWGGRRRQCRETGGRPGPTAGDRGNRTGLEDLLYAQNAHEECLAARRPAGRPAARIPAGSTERPNDSSRG